jgi:hypothetical protein
MAAPYLNSAERMSVYRQLFLLNRSFHLITQRLQEVAKAGMMNASDLRDMLGMTQEVQLEINTTLANKSLWKSFEPTTNNAVVVQLYHYQQCAPPALAMAIQRE